MTGRPRAGTPCWFEVSAPDVTAATTFYGTLFGWDHRPDDQAYRTVFRQDRSVAAIRAAHPDEQPAWLVHLAAPDLGATVVAVVAAGGQVLEQPHDAPAGRVAVAAEPTGGVFGLLETNGSRGSEVMAEPGAACWAEASSKDPSMAGTFFAVVFGLAAKRPYPRYTYVLLRADGEDVAGILGYSHERRPRQGPAAWLVYFQVADTDTAVRTASELGGKCVEKPHDTAFGRFAVVADPFGARFAVITREQ